MPDNLQKEAARVEVGSTAKQLADRATSSIEELKSIRSELAVLRDRVDVDVNDYFLPIDLQELDELDQGIRDAIQALNDEVNPP